MCITALSIGQTQSQPSFQVPGNLISCVSQPSGVEVRFVPPPPKNIVPQTQAVSILCSLVPLSQLFCEKVALLHTSGDQAMVERPQN
jgi:hypothetical protein